MPRSPRRPRTAGTAVIISRIALALALVIFAARAITSLRQESATWDETHYFGIGKYLLEEHRWDVPGSILHPPLAFYLSSLPLLFVPSDPTPWHYNAPDRTDPRFLSLDDLERGRALLSSPANAHDRLLSWSRSMMVAAALVLGLLMFSWARDLYGRPAAIAAAVLFALDPNLIAHARLITPDIVLTTCFFATVYAFWRLLTGQSVARTVAFGAALGGCLLSKYSGALVLPALAVLALVWFAQRRALPWKALGAGSAIAVALIWISYFGDPSPYMIGLNFQREHAAAGHASYLMGDVSTTGWWYYFLVAFAIKTPGALLALIGIALALRGRTQRAGARGAAVPVVDSSATCFLLVPAAIVGAFFSFNHQSLGLRYILPIYPFLIVFASQSVRLWPRGRAAKTMIGVLGAWSVAASVWIHPHYLAYFNEFIGGPEHAAAYLVDSNLDWGQDLPALARFMSDRGIRTVYLSYFGGDDPARYGIDYEPLPSYELPKPASSAGVSVPRGSWVAVSATNLEGVYFNGADPFAALRLRTPDAVIGYSIFVYRFP